MPDRVGLCALGSLGAGEDCVPRVCVSQPQGTYRPSWDSFVSPLTPVGLEVTKGEWSKGSLLLVKCFLCWSQDISMPCVPQIMLSTCMGLPGKCLFLQHFCLQLFCWWGSSYSCSRRLWMGHGDQYRPPFALATCLKRTPQNLLVYHWVVQRTPKSFLRLNQNLP